MAEELTKEDVRKIEAEITKRKLEIRPKLIEAVKEARAQGDLSENFEYYAAKREKNQNESRIRYLERILKFAKVISTESRRDEVGINDTVTLYFPEDGEEEVYHIVTSIRGQSLEGKISNISPLGKAVMGKKLGEAVTVELENGSSYVVEIRNIEKTGEKEEESIRKF
jgi:possible transcription elongation factor|nr:transcription elongation factor GreA [uncultured Oribacterium sp.]